MPIISPGSSLINAATTAASQHSELMNTAASWSSTLSSQLGTLSSAITNPNVTVTWDDIESSVPVGWGAAYSAPTLPTVPTIPMADNVYGPSQTALHLFTLGNSSTPTTVLENTRYTPEMQSAVKSLLDTVLGGTALLPQDTWDDIYTAAEADLTEAYAGAVLQAGRVAGMLSALPGPALLARVDKATTEHRKGLQKARMALAIEQAKAQREDMTKALDAARQHDQSYDGIHNVEWSRVLQVSTARHEAEVKTFLAGWQAVQMHYAAALAGTQAAAIPASIKVESEKARTAVEMQILAKAIENAKLAQSKGVAEAQLLQQRLQFVDAQGLEVQKVIAQVAAHMAGAYLSAGSVSYGFSASETYGNSNTGSVCECP